jgi:hypothetical protein
MYTVRRRLPIFISLLLPGSMSFEILEPDRDI